MGIMISLFRLFFLFGLFLISQPGIAITATFTEYHYDVNYIVLDEEIYSYDTSSNPRHCCHPLSSVNTKDRYFFAFASDFLATKSAGNATSKSKGVIHVTKDGVALPPGAKHKIPDNYVQNPHRSGNYGEIVNGKFKERLRIDPPTPPGQKGPNYSHYHKNGKGTHYSPRPGDKDPGF